MIRIFPGYDESGFGQDFLVGRVELEAVAVPFVHSEFFVGGVICYHNRVKVIDVGVPASIISKHGPASKEVAIKMAEGIRKRMRTDIGLSATGAAGPNPLPPAPVGSTFIALASNKGTEWKELHLQGTRSEIREKAAQAALGLLWLHFGGEEMAFKFGKE